MSAINKPLVNSSTSTTPEQQIAVEAIASMDKYNIGIDVNDPTRREVGILFTMNLDQPQRQKKLVYPGAEAAAIILRDASFAAIETLLANTTV